MYSTLKSAIFIAKYPFNAVSTAVVISAYLVGSITSSIAIVASFQTFEYLSINSASFSLSNSRTYSLYAVRISLLANFL